MQYLRKNVLVTWVTQSSKVWKRTAERNKAKLEEKIKNMLTQIDEGIAQDNAPDADTMSDAMDSRLLARKTGGAQRAEQAAAA